MISVSVIIPAFNAERTLAEALDSVLSQDRLPEQVIVVDDGSTDSTAEIADGLPGVRLVRQANGGPASALNAGVALSTGTVFGFLDADDIWPRDTVGNHLDNLDRHRNADASVGWSSEFVCPTLDAAEARRFRPRDPQVGWLSGATFVRSTSFSRVGEFDAHAREWPWIDWAYRAKLQGLAFAIFDKIVLRRRLHPLSLSMRPGNNDGANLIGAARQALLRRRLSKKQD